MASSIIDYLDCKWSVHVEAGGHKNLELHCTLKACRIYAKTNQLARQLKPNQSLDAFFKA